jgi:hypothetical protein
VLDIDGSLHIRNLVPNNGTRFLERSPLRGPRGEATGRGRGDKRCGEWSEASAGLRRLVPLDGVGFGGYGGVGAILAAGQGGLA